MDNKSPEAFRTISEVADWLGVPAHVLRFWESRFGQVKPVKRAGGRRYYRPSDMELLGGIRKLLHEDGMTIRGVQKLLRENGVRYVAAMSPPLDQPGDLRDVSPAETEALEAPRPAPRHAAPVYDDEIEDAVEAEAPPEPASEAATPDVAPEIAPEIAAEPDSHDGADDLQAPAMDSPAPDAVGPETDATEMVAAAAEEVETGTDDMPQEETAEDVSPVFESAALETSQESDAQDTAAAHTGAEDISDTPLDDSLEALEFLSHEAEPDTSEGPEAAPDAGDAEAIPHAPEDDGPVEERTAATAEELADTTDDALPPDVAAGPFAPDPAQEAAQDTTWSAVAEDTPSTETEDDRETAPEEEAPQDTAPRADIPARAEGTPAPGISPAPGTPAPEQLTPPPAEPATPEPTPPQAPGPDLVLPDIGPDLEDDAALPATPALAAMLRRARPLTHRPAAPAPLDPAQIKAYSDRLQALAGRLGATSDTRHPF